MNREMFKNHNYVVRLTRDGYMDVAQVVKENPKSFTIEPIEMEDGKILEHPLTRSFPKDEIVLTTTSLSAVCRVRYMHQLVWRQKRAVEKAANEAFRMAIDSLKQMCLSQKD